MNTADIKKILPPGNWKRVSKKGSGADAIREFEDAKQGLRYIVNDSGKIVGAPGLDMILVQMSIAPQIVQLAEDAPCSF